MRPRRHIEKAFVRGQAAAVALLAEPRRGSPAISLIAGGVFAGWRQRKNVPVYAFCRRMVAASVVTGLAWCADEIIRGRKLHLWGPRCDLISFGFHELISAKALSARGHTAGKDQIHAFIVPARARRGHCPPKDLQKANPRRVIAHGANNAGCEAARAEDWFTGEIFGLAEVHRYRALPTGSGILVPVDEDKAWATR